MCLAIIGITLLFAATHAAAGHPKTDIATIDDGSILYGEILSVKYATLSLKTDAAGILNIEWRRITGLTSKYEYHVEVTGGAHHYGKLPPPPIRPGILRSSVPWGRSRSNCPT